MYVLLIENVLNAYQDGYSKSMQEKLLVSKTVEKDSTHKKTNASHAQIQIVLPVLDHLNVLIVKEFSQFLTGQLVLKPVQKEKFQSMEFVLTVKQDVKNVVQLILINVLNVNYHSSFTKEIVLKTAQKDGFNLTQTQQSVLNADHIA